MSLTPAHYIEFLDKNGEPLGSDQCFQSFFKETRQFSSKNYQYAPFSLSGDHSSLGGDAGSCEIVSVANPITAGLLKIASDESRIVNVSVVLLACPPPVDDHDFPSWSEVNFLSSTFYVAGSFAYSDSATGEPDGRSVVTLRLVSPLSYVSGIAPTRRLTPAQVGPLPSSGGINF